MFWKYTRRELPNAGAMQYAFTQQYLRTQLLYGWGAVPQRSFLRTTVPPMVQAQDALVNGIGGGPIQGQFVTQPLVGQDFFYGNR